MRRSALYGVPLADREPGHQEGDPDRIADTARRFEQLVRRLTVEQKLALTDLSLDLRRPWMLRKLCQRPLTVEDEGERQALLSGLDVLAGPGKE
jgi:hypothetical protein